MPCYNEQEIISDTVRQLNLLIVSLISKGKISHDSFILFVNDGSDDDTWTLIKDEYKKSRYVNALCLTSNSRQQNALIAGLSAVYGKCDMAVSIDADLQDDIGVMEQMIDLCESGADIVYGVRNDRSSDSFFKRFTAHIFYRLMKLLGTEIVSDHAEYRLMSDKALGELLKYKERDPFVRGIIPLTGLRSEKVYYARKPRTAGKSKYSVGKMISLAIDGITSLSIRPITFILALGVIILSCAAVALLCMFIMLAVGKRVSGLAYLLGSVWFLGGLQLTAIGVIGEYIGRAHFEVKNRPRYHTGSFLWHDDENNKE